MILFMIVGVPLFTTTALWLLLELEAKLNGKTDL